MRTVAVGLVASMVHGAMGRARVAPRPAPARSDRGLERVALSIAAIVAVTACYQPELHNCVVDCDKIEQCAPGLVCDRGKCAAAEGMCKPGTNAGDDASESDAGSDGETDALPQGKGKLLITISGKGTVEIKDRSECANDSDVDTKTCEETFDLGTKVELKARKIPNDFVGWAMCPSIDGLDTKKCTVSIDGPSREVKATFADNGRP